MRCSPAPRSAHTGSIQAGIHDMSDQSLAARAAIADLVHTYALNIRTGNAVDCAKLFTDDAVFEIKEAPLGAREPAHLRTRLVGREAISSYLIRASGGQTRVCPMIHNLLIRVDGPEAASNCLMTSLIWPTGEQLIGEYQDSYRLETVWRFSARLFTISSDAPHVRSPAPR